MLTSSSFRIKEEGEEGIVLYTIDVYVFYGIFGEF